MGIVLLPALWAIPLCDEGMKVFGWATQNCWGVSLRNFDAVLDREIRGSGGGKPWKRHGASLRRSGPVSSISPQWNDADTHESMFDGTHTHDVYAYTASTLPTDITDTGLRCIPQRSGREQRHPCHRGVFQAEPRHGKVANRWSCSPCGRACCSSRHDTDHLPSPLHCNAHLRHGIALVSLERVCKKLGIGGGASRTVRLVDCAVSMHGAPRSKRAGTQARCGDVARVGVVGVPLQLVVRRPPSLSVPSWRSSAFSLVPSSMVTLPSSPSSPPWFVTRG